MDVYVASLDFVEFANSLVRQMPGGRAGIDSQLLRAASSVSLNIAEGTGEFSVKDKVRFYRMARRSATECAAALDVSQRLGLIRNTDTAPGRSILRRVIAMLTKLVKRLEGSADCPDPTEAVTDAEHDTGNPTVGGESHSEA